MLGINSHTHLLQLLKHHIATSAQELFQPIDRVITDSRTAINVQNKLFFALVTTKNNGHKYISQLIKQGVSALVVSDKQVFEQTKNQVFTVLVTNTTDALQEFGANYIQQFSAQRIAITGSNGKTIVKEWLSQLLAAEFSIAKSPKSYNSQIGVPLSALEVNASHDFMVFEAGISQPNEMQKLASIIQPNYGIFTNIGDAHSVNFESLAQKVREKANLFTTCSWVVFRADFPEIANTLAINSSFFGWTTNPALTNFLLVHWNKPLQQISFLWNQQELVFTIPFSDSAAFENATHAILMALYLKVSPNTIQQTLTQLQPVAMRLQQVAGINNTTLINDSYNADVTSLKIALDFLFEQVQHTEKTVFLSDFEQLTKNEHELYHEIAVVLNEYSIQNLVLVGPQISRIASLVNAQFIQAYGSTQELIQYIKPQEFSNQAILLKGARSFEFEQILALFQQKSHRAELVVSLDALVNNYNYFKTKLGNSVKIMAMVKAFSYGSGSHEIAKVLAHQNVDYLAVAYADEGVELRQNGVDLPIMVMNANAESFDLILKYNLEPEIYSFEQLQAFLLALNNSVYTHCGIHLKIDTGMYRLGFMPNEVPQVIQLIQAIQGVELKSMFTHLSSADDANADEFTLHQLDLFLHTANQAEATLGYSVLKHALNSAGIQRFTNYEMDMVRLGVGLYGIGVNPTEQKHLIEVSTFKGSISQLKHVQAGAAVGYNRMGKVEKDSVIATVNIGYADGLPRSLSNGKYSVSIQNTPCPIIGNVCMDMCMVDVSHLSQCSVGDEVVVFGNNYSIKNMAVAAQTIPYELLVGISSRVKRIYVRHES